MTLPSTLYSGVIIALNGKTGPEYFRAGDSLMKPAMVCMHDAAADEIKLCVTAGIPFGIVGCDADHDLSTVYTVGERVPVWVLGSGVEIWVLTNDDTTITITKGINMETADLTTYTGGIKTQPAYVAVTTVTADSTGRLYTSRFLVGKALTSASITSEVARYCPVLI